MNATSWASATLGLWLILTGLIPLLHMNFPHEGTAMAVLAIIAGVLYLFGATRRRGWWS